MAKERPQSAGEPHADAVRTDSAPLILMTGVDDGAGRGPLPRVLRRLLAGVLTLAVVALLGVQLSQAIRAADTRLGVWIPGREAVVAHVYAGSPADRAGLRRGDVILSIGGVPVKDSEDIPPPAAGLKRNTPATLEIERNGTVESLVISPGAPVEWGSWSVFAAVAVTYLALALLVWLRCDLADVRARLLFLLSAALALEFAAPDFPAGGLSTLVLALGGLVNGFQMGVELHLASVIPRPHRWLERRPWVAWTFHATGLGYGLLCAGSAINDWQGQPLPLAWNADELSTWFETWAFPIWALAVTGLLGSQALRFPRPLGRQQAGLVFLGALPWTAVVLLNLAWHLTGRPWPSGFSVVWNLALLVYPLAVFVAIFRYQLFDLEVVVRRGLLYTLLSMLLILTFYSVMAAGGVLLSRRWQGQAQVLPVAAACLTMGLLFSPLRRMLDAWIGRRVFPERHALRQRLIALAGQLPALGSLPAMGAFLVERICETFQSRSATVLLTDPKTNLLVVLATSRSDADKLTDQPIVLPRDDAGFDVLRQSRRPLSAAQVATLGGRLKAFRPALLVPLTSHDVLVGLLALEKKRSGRRFVAEELELLSLLSHHVATVFENARLFKSATYESLTGLLRRDAVLQQLEREIQRAVRYRRPLTIAMADLDRFKQVNDRFGHLVGDAVLQQAARALADGVRHTDTIGRYGGEEFLLLLPETDPHGARAVAEKLREAVHASATPVDGHGQLRVTVSIGLATLERFEFSRAVVTDLLQAADGALYRAKEQGRNRVESATVSEDERRHPFRLRYR